MINQELLANLQKTIERTSSSTSSGKDIERALVQTLEDWIEEQRREGMTAIQDILESLTLRLPIPRGGDTCSLASSNPTAFTVKSMPQGLTGMTPFKVENKQNLNNDDNAAFKPHHNEEDMLFRFEESPPSPRRRDSINDDKDNEDQQDQEQDEENTVPDSYLPSQYGSVPINITRPFSSGNAAIKRGTKSKAKAADTDEASFEPPHEYYARTYQQTNAFERPSVSVRKQSLI